ncbi:hypothetical protein PR048_003838 [Dryococelus australis]|uniref:Uncharacterized protein n=1 Tax=Dryococelus australis TaxID=614101 RepID=A0ABQ9IQT0_9NEOP|nr:hypothetical protein PR048_003838 [Dryococelus australis]
MSDSYQLPFLYDQLETKLIALETSSVLSDIHTAMLFPLVESCLTEGLRAWQCSGVSQHEDNRLQEEQISITAGLANSKDVPNAVVYIFCQGAHFSGDCFKARRMTIIKIHIATVWCVYRVAMLWCKMVCVVCDVKHTAVVCAKLGCAIRPPILCSRCLLLESKGRQVTESSSVGGYQSNKVNHKITLENPGSNYVCGLDALSQDTICLSVPTAKREVCRRILALKSKMIAVLYKLLTGERIILGDRLVTVNAYLGWTLMGNVPDPETCSQTMIVSILVSPQMSLSALWELDVSGIWIQTNKGRAITILSTCLLLRPREPPTHLQEQAHTAACYSFLAYREGAMSVKWWPTNCCTLLCRSIAEKVISVGYTPIAGDSQVHSESRMPWLSASRRPPEQLRCAHFPRCVDAEWTRLDRHCACASYPHIIAFSPSSSRHPDTASTQLVSAILDHQHASVISNLRSSWIPCRIQPDVTNVDQKRLSGSHRLPAKAGKPSDHCSALRGGTSLKYKWQLVHLITIPTFTSRTSCSAASQRGFSFARLPLPFSMACEARKEGASRLTLAMLVCVLEGLDQTQSLVHRPPHWQVVHGDLPQHLLVIYDVETTEGHPSLLVVHTIVAGYLPRLAPLLARSVDPRQVTEVAVARCRNYLASYLAELIGAIRESHNLRGAHEHGCSITDRDVTKGRQIGERKADRRGRPSQEKTTCLKRQNLSELSKLQSMFQVIFQQCPGIPLSTAQIMIFFYSMVKFTTGHMTSLQGPIGSHIASPCTRKIGPALSPHFVQDVPCTRTCARNSRARSASHARLALILHRVKLASTNLEFKHKTLSSRTLKFKTQRGCTLYSKNTHDHGATSSSSSEEHKGVSATQTMVAIATYDAVEEIRSIMQVISKSNPVSARGKAMVSPWVERESQSTSSKSRRGSACVRLRHFPHTPDDHQLFCNRTCNYNRFHHLGHFSVSPGKPPPLPSGLA